MTYPDNLRPARTALETHDHLRAVNEREPDADLTPGAWLEWQADEYRPAYESWSYAMDQLAAAGYDGSRHPLNFRPYCEKVIGQ